MAPEKNTLAPLKTLVFSMGVILIVGTILLVAMVWKKISADALHACAGGHVDLAGRGTPSASTISGQTMYVTFSKHGSSETVMIDTCSGKILGSLLLDMGAHK